MLLKFIIRFRIYKHAYVEMPEMVAKYLEILLKENLNY